MTLPVWTVKDVKRIDTPDGGGMSCVLCMDGQPVAKCCDDGRGGMVELYGWKNPVDPLAFAEFVKAQPPMDMSEYDMDPVTQDDGMVVWGLVYDLEEGQDNV